MSDDPISKFRRIGYEDLHEVYTADFETTGAVNLKIDGCTRVFLWSLVNVKSKQAWYGYDIESFMDKVTELECKRVYFHNLKFDGSFLLSYLLSNDMYIPGVTGDMLAPDGNIMEIRVMMKEGVRTDFRCSFNKSGVSVKALGVMYPDAGMKLDPVADGEVAIWDRYYQPNETPSRIYVKYCIQDSMITAHFIEDEYKAGRTGVTSASDAYHGFRAYVSGETMHMPWEKFFKIYPKLTQEEDDFARGSYRGGFTHLNPKYVNQVLKDIHVSDIRGMYPDIMIKNKLPFGKPIPLDEEPDREVYLYIVKFWCSFTLKDKGIPFLKVKFNPLFDTSEPIRDCPEVIELTLTCIDYELFKEHYDVHIEYGHTYHAYQIMNEENNYLAKYIKREVDERAKYPKSVNPYMNSVHKLNANSLYGSHGMRPMFQNVTPELDSNGILTLGVEYERGEGRYIPIATFITAHARARLVRDIAKNYDTFVYCDTDSIHTIGPPKGLVFGEEGGAWEAEGRFPHARYLRPKTYAFADENKQLYRKENIYGETESSITCAGMPNAVKNQMTFDEFVLGVEIQGKLMAVKSPGGVVLMERSFTINDTNYY